MRGPQSALFGRNTLGGLVNITSARPSLDDWTGSFSVPFGNYGAWAMRGGASGPGRSGDKLGVGVSFAQVERDGFTVNDVTGNDVDSRSAFSAKAQMLWTPGSDWESAGDLQRRARARRRLRAQRRRRAAQPIRFTRRATSRGSPTATSSATTISARRAGRAGRRFESRPGFVNWKTQDVTDLDYTPLPLAHARQHGKGPPVHAGGAFRVGDGDAGRALGRARLRWQGGVFLFTQNYDQDAVNSYAPFVLSRPVPVDQHIAASRRSTTSASVCYGQGTFTFSERLDVAAGARVDYENKSATLDTFFDAGVRAATSVDAEDSFSNVSPQVSVAYRGPAGQDGLRDGRPRLQGRRVQSRLAAGQRGATARSTAWNFEGGVKTMWAGGRVSANAASSTSTGTTCS